MTNSPFSASRSDDAALDAEPQITQRPFVAWLRATRREFEPHFRRSLEQTSYGRAPEALRNALAAAVLSPGKRIRPGLVLLSCEAHGGSRERALAAACAVEMIHAYSLVHDDLPCMDDDQLRRGQPTIHVAFGEALAVLAGDALQALAFELLARQEHAELGQSQAHLLALACGPAGMVGGQVLDLEAEGRECTALQVEAIHRAKTAALLQASLQLGACAAGAAPELWTAYGGFIGRLFQAADDLLDATASTADLGKTAGKDAASEKSTLVRAMGVDKAKAHAADLVIQAQKALPQNLVHGRQELLDLPEYLLERNR